MTRPVLLTVLLLPARAITEPADGLVPGSDPITVRKVMVTDCRVLRAFVGTPVDGTVFSRHYGGGVAEYPERSGAGTQFDFNNNDGLHITLADDRGFQMVVLRGGASTKMVADATDIGHAGTGKLIWELAGGQAVQTAIFDKPVKAKRISFFETKGGSIGDVSFFRIEPRGAVPGKPSPWSPAEPIALKPEDPTPLADPDAQDEQKVLPDNILNAVQETFGSRPQSIYGLKNSSEPFNLSLKKGVPLHLLSPPQEKVTGISAFALRASCRGPARRLRLTVIVHDPLNPRRKLSWIELMVKPGTAFSVTLDIPDQVLFEGSRFYLTLVSDEDVRLVPVKPGSTLLQSLTVAREDALAEAIAWRKWLMRVLFGALSEPRPWGSYHSGLNREQFYTRSKYAARCPELFETLDQCHTLDPKDSMVRQHREWIFALWLHGRKQLSDIPAPPKPPAGVPGWAWYPRLAWLEARRMAEWWMDNRMVPTGEFGGRVNDDTTMYQQFADLPFFETGGVAAKILDGARRLAAHAEKTTLRDGVNTRMTDALHAYEEGINHLALMARWHYGDPIRLERCMESARTMKKLTILTPDGRRHFPDDKHIAWSNLKNPPKPGKVRRASPALWHTALTVANYNRNEEALATLREWADGWLRLMKPETRRWPSGIEVLSGKATESRRDRPLRLGESTQAATFMYLCGLTSDPRYLSPFYFYFEQGILTKESRRYAADAYALGSLDNLDRDTLLKIASQDGALSVLVTGSPDLLLQETIGPPHPRGPSISDLYSANRWPDMYTSAEQYTDRCGIGRLIEKASDAYLGGFCGRNKYNPTHAVSWEGFGTDFSALVLKNHRHRLKVALYSHRADKLKGAFRVWALEHGIYRIRRGTDTTGDFQIDGEASIVRRELMKADRIELEIAPGSVTLIEIEQVKKLAPIFGRADLAVSAEDLKLKGQTLSGLVHNVGSADVDGVEVAVRDGAGKKLAQTEIGSLPAPDDLIARTSPFSLKLPGPATRDWELVIDPENRIKEIYEGNNRAVLIRAKE